MFLWFTSFTSGDHCNTVHKNASEIAREMVENMEEHLGHIESISGKTNGERILQIFDRINRLSHAFSDNETYFGFSDGSWSSVSLANTNSMNNAKIVLKVK